MLWQKQGVKRSKACKGHLLVSKITFLIENISSIYWDEKGKMKNQANANKDEPIGDRTTNRWNIRRATTKTQNVVRKGWKRRKRLTARGWEWNDENKSYEFWARTECTREYNVINNDVPLKRYRKRPWKQPWRSDVDCRGKRDEREREYPQHWPG